jgi:hypothetical protein
MIGVVILSPYTPSNNFYFQSEGSSSMVLEETGHNGVS